MQILSKMILPGWRCGEKKWEMDFNPSKCEVLHITRSNNPTIYQYKLHGHILKPTTNAKYLGVTITNNLSWNKHIENITSKASRTLGFIKRNIQTKHQGIRTMAYQTLVRQQLEYASTVWNPHTLENVKKLEQVQRRAIRWVKHDYSRFNSVSAMQHELGWKTLENRRADARLILFFQIVNNLVAVPLPPYLQRPTRISRHINTLSYIPVRAKTNVFQSSFFPATIPIWNKLPEDLASQAKLVTFKSQVGKISHNP